MSARRFRARIDLDDRDQLVAQAGDSRDEVVPALDTVEGTRIHAAVLVDIEIGISGHEQGIVLGSLDVPLAGSQGLPLDERLEEDSVNGQSPRGRRRRKRN